MTDETHVTDAGYRVTVTLDGTDYVLRPITYGEASRLAQEEAAIFNGGPAMLSEAIRRALEAKGNSAALIEAVDAHEDADLAMTAIAISRPHPQEPAEEHKEWRREWRTAQLALLKASARRQVAEAAVATVPEVAAARAALTAVDRQRKAALLAVALVQPQKPDIEALPASHVEALYMRAQAMARPGVTEGKA